MKQKIFIIMMAGITSISSATVYNSNGSFNDVSNKVSLASAGDTVTVPVGTYSWGSNGWYINLNKAIMLEGLTTTTNPNIQLTKDGPYYGSGAVNLSANGASISNLTFTGIANNTGPSSTPISVYGCQWFRICYVTYNGPAFAGYFVYTSAANGLCDHCIINGNNGSLQTFMIRGATSVWNNPNTMGTSNSIYIEDCVYSGTSYMQENDGAAQSVVRFNTNNAAANLDAHMIETATDASGVPHGSRQLEAYNNQFTVNSSYDIATIAGGTGMYFNNTTAGTSPFGFDLQEYGAHASSPTYLGTYTTPAMSPIPDQIGMGEYPQSAGTEPVYIWGNQTVGGINVPFYGNTVSAGAISQYGSTFHMTSSGGTPYMLKKLQDFFIGVIGGTFPSTTDIGIGTFVQMGLSSPTVIGQAWWVTDRGSWNTLLPPNTSGILYKWTGVLWMQYYEPFIYPHPLQGITIATNIPPFFMGQGNLLIHQ